ncbi:MAG: hypothetical protein U1E73_10660 [Planctomycetota bacterium]
MRTPLPVLLLSAAALAQSQPAPTFAPPVRVMAGDKMLGQGRLYPSPVLHDVNGDGLPDIVVGDLPGRLTFALRKPGTGAPVFAAEQDMLGADGKQIDFANW